MNTSDKLAALVKMGWTQSSISSETGISQGTISRILNGVHPDPRASNAYAIDKLFARAISRVKDAA